MKHCFTLILLLLLQTLQGQLKDNFDDDSFPTNPDWIGDVSDFIVNQEGELQLNALEAGSSTLLSAIDIDSDTISFGLKWKLDFSPSTSNSLRIFLSIDNSDPTMASGYILEIGESGSNDAIRFVRLDSGVPSELAVGNLGAVASSPDVNMRVDYISGGLWTLNVDYSGGPLLEEDIIIMDDTYDPRSPSYFGWECSYTSSRTDLFFFDDVNISPFERDETPPEILDVNIISSNTIQVEFDEPVDEFSAAALSNYTLEPFIEITNAEIVNPVLVNIIFSQDFPSDQPFSITVENIEDLVGNKLIGEQRFELNFARLPVEGDLIINEILFASLLGREDFVEVRNLTDDFIDLSGHILGNNTKSGSSGAQLILEGAVIAPRGYLAFTEVSLILEVGYDVLFPENIIEQNIPDFNNDEGNVFIASPNGSILDSYDYSEDHHNEFFGVIKGVSLERISSALSSNDPSNWTSASASGKFATPGYVNSASIPSVTVEENFDFVQKVFSPDGDNNEDFMILGYNFDGPGYIGTIEIRDPGGFLVKKLISNQTLSSEGIITWNGSDEDGKLANIGMYILIGEAFNLEGDRIPIKKVCVLTGRM